MDKEQIRSFLGEGYPGWKKFMSDFVKPLFEGSDIEDYRGANALTADIGVLAERCGIKDVRLCAKIGADYSEVYIYDATVSNHVLLRRNRVTVREIARRLARQKTAFIAFHYDNGITEWRISLYQDFAGKETNAKRYTFLVGPGQNLRTVTDNFHALHETLRNNGGLAENDYVRCFDVEALSNDFFNEYKRQYEGFVKYITGKCFKKIGGKWKEVADGVPNEAIYGAFNHEDKTVRDYVKKMLGRIVFLHFLQKKGWLGAKKSWGDGDREFMLHLFQKATEEQRDNFLDGVLEPLYERAFDDDRSKSDDIFNVPVVAIGRVKIPYLNGGLFTPDAADNKTVRFPRDYFRNFLEFLSRYNFTIDENDPTEAEVGVDPEMLSRIFENLLEDNKDKGAIYTPKPIVEYMCRESLKAYLKTDIPEKDHKAIDEFVKSYDGEKLSKKLAAKVDAKLKKVKICDPAIGSGAFPMGMLRELFFCRTALEDDLDELSPAEIKRQIIQENIYGVDIEKGAVDIARLRFWLSLVVDEDSPHTLPNLDFKIMQGNSLLESYKGVNLDSLLKNASHWQSKKGKAVSYSQPELALGGDCASRVITELMSKYYSTDNRKSKERIIEEINKHVKGFIKGQMVNPDLNAEIDALECQNDKFFLWHTWFADVFENGGFDIVIGNPPYVEAKKLKGAVKLFRNKYTCASGTADLSVYFYELGLRLATVGGILAYICTNKFFVTEYGAKLRKFLREHNLRKIINFEQCEVFEDILVSSVITMVENAYDKERKSIQYRAFNKLNHREFISEFQLKCGMLEAYPLSALTEREWSFADEGMLALKEKIRDAGICIGDMPTLHVYRGITTGFNPAFIVNDAKRIELISQDPSCEVLVKNMLQGRNIRKWQYKESDEFLLQTGYDVDVKSHFPVVYSHLQQWETEMKNRSDQGMNWWNLRACKYYDEFERPEKIIWGLTSDKWSFAYDNQKHYLPSNAYMLTSDELPIKFLLGLLNSSILHFYFGFIGVMTAGGAYTLKAATIEALPIPTAMSSQQKRISALVDKILAAKNSDPNADTSSLESEIDEKVFDLYGLTPEEREIVKGAVK